MFQMQIFQDFFGTKASTALWSWFSRSLESVFPCKRSLFICLIKTFGHNWSLLPKFTFFDVSNKSFGGFHFRSPLALIFLLVFYSPRSVFLEFLMLKGSLFVFWSKLSVKIQKKIVFDVSNANNAGFLSNGSQKLLWLGFPDLQGPFSSRSNRKSAPVQLSDQNFQSKLNLLEKKHFFHLSNTTFEGFFLAKCGSMLLLVFWPQFPCL